MKTRYAPCSITVAILGALAGCGTLSAPNLPTLQHCERVSYEREGTSIRISADCQAPIGAPLIQ